MGARDPRPLARKAGSTYGPHNELPMRDPHDSREHALPTSPCASQADEGRCAPFPVVLGWEGAQHWNPTGQEATGMLISRSSFLVINAPGLSGPAEPLQRRVGRVQSLCGLRHLSLGGHLGLFSIRMFTTSSFFLPGLSDDGLAADGESTTD